MISFSFGFNLKKMIALIYSYKLSLNKIIMIVAINPVDTIPFQNCKASITGTTKLAFKSSNYVSANNFPRLQIM